MKFFRLPVVAREASFERIRVAIAVCTCGYVQRDKVIGAAHKTAVRGVSRVFRGAAYCSLN